MSFMRYDGGVETGGFRLVARVFYSSDVLWSEANRLLAKFSRTQKVEMINVADLSHENKAGGATSKIDVA